MTIVTEISEPFVKSCAKKSDLIFANIQCAAACSLEKKLNLKFKLLYLLNHISCFNKIYKIRCMSAHVHNLKVWLKSVLLLLKYRIF